LQRGSGVSASTSSWTAMSASRSGREPQPVEAGRRSCPHARAASTSTAFAASRSAVRSRSAAAIVRRAASTAGAPGRAHPGRGAGGPLRGGADGTVFGGLGVTGRRRGADGADGAHGIPGCHAGSERRRSGTVGGGRFRPGPHRRPRCRCSAGSPGRTGRRR
jgi:hypothetical protein